MNEPWSIDTISDAAGTEFALLLSSDGEIVIRCISGESIEYLERIVACVNLLTGVPIEDINALLEAKDPRWAQTVRSAVVNEAAAIRAGYDGRLVEAKT